MDDRTTLDKLAERGLIPPTAVESLLDSGVQPVTQVPDDEPRFWVCDPNGDNACPADWVGIVDEYEGGIIMYVHPSRADYALGVVRNSVV